jgi:predicted transport protein
LQEERIVAKTPEQAAQAMIDNLEERTGRSLADWFTLLDKQHLDKHGDYLKYLKGEKGVTHGYANLIALKHREAKAGESHDDPVEAQYAGAKQGLRPIYDRLVATVEKIGDDVEIAPKKSYVSLRRKKQFGLVQPSTKDRVDLGLNLKGETAGGRLEDSGHFNAMVTHRIRLNTPQDVDAEVKAWLKQAYDAAG